MASSTNPSTNFIMSDNTSSSSSTEVPIETVGPTARDFPILANDPAVNAWNPLWKQRIASFLDNAGFDQWTCVPLRKGLDDVNWANNSVCIIIYIEVELSKSRRASLRDALLTALLENDVNWSRDTLCVDISQGTLRPLAKVHLRTGSLVSCKLSEQDEQETKRTATLTGTLKITKRGKTPELVLLSCHHLATESLDPLPEDSCVPVTRPCRTTHDRVKEITGLEANIARLKQESGPSSYLDKSLNTLKIWRRQNQLKKKEATKIPLPEQIGSTDASSGLHRVMLTRRGTASILRDPGKLDWLLIKPNSSLHESNMVTVSNDTFPVRKVRSIADLSERKWRPLDELHEDTAAVLRVGGMQGRVSETKGFVNGIRLMSRVSDTRTSGPDGVEVEQGTTFYYEAWIVVPAIAGHDFSEDGDSGSLILAKNGCAAVGMLTGGSPDDRYSVVQDMGDVLDNIKERLNAEEVVFAGCKRIEEGS